MSPLFLIRSSEPTCSEILVSLELEAMRSLLARLNGGCGRYDLFALKLFDEKEDGKVAKITCPSSCLAPARRDLRSMPVDRSQERTHATLRRPLHRGWPAPQPALVPAGGFSCVQTFGTDALRAS